MITVTKESFQDWIRKQPDERPVDMGQNYCDEPCGCVMVHYGKDKGWKFRGCGTKSWCVEDGEDIAEFEEGHLNKMIKRGSINRSKTYGELKKDLI